MSTHLNDRGTKKRSGAEIVINSETYFAPSEIVDFYQSQIEASPLLAKMYTDGFTIPDIAQFKVIQNFTRVELEKNVNFYSNGLSRKTKTLLICFCGASNRMGLTAPSFLQRLDANRFDVLMLVDPLSSHFRFGISGFGNCLPELADNIQKRCLADEYDRVCALGHSMGALVALRYSQYGRCDRAIAIAPSLVDDTFRVFLNHEAVDAFDPLCACRFDKVQNPTIVFSEGNHKDKIFSESLGRALKARLYCLPNATGHATLLEAYRLRRTKGLLDLLLLPTLPEHVLHEAVPVDLPEDKTREPDLYFA
jgi:hypothetical protein